MRAHRVNHVSQGPEKSQPPEVGIKPGLQDLKANTRGDQKVRGKALL